jgi:hypothetical protein
VAGDSAAGTFMDGRVLDTAAEGALPVSADGLAARVDEMALGIAMAMGGGTIPEFIFVAVTHVVLKSPQALGAC